MTCVPSCPSHLCYPHLGQLLPGQIVDFPGAVSFDLASAEGGPYHRGGSDSRRPLPGVSDGYQLGCRHRVSSMKVVLLTKLQDGVCNEIRLLRSTSFESRQQATGTRIGVLASAVTWSQKAPVIEAVSLWASRPHFPQPRARRKTSVISQLSAESLSRTIEFKSTFHQG